MEETSKYIESFLTMHKFNINSNKTKLFNEFVADPANVEAVKEIQENQKKMLDKWTLKNRVDDIVQQYVMLPNAIVNKKYESKIDFLKLDWNNIVFSDFTNLENSGLHYDSSEEIISGIPSTSGDLKTTFLFRLEGEADDSVLHEKPMTIIINPDPKSLWKNLESDQNDVFWKEDNVAEVGNFLDKKIVISSKRGRSHANVGSFRDDDYAYKNFSDTGWSVLAVSDGAGSASDSRQGSKLACEWVISYFESNFTTEFLKDFDQTLLKHSTNPDAETQKQISHFVYNNLSKAAHDVHKKLEEFALNNNKELKDFHSTLIFTLVKKYEFGYAILTFGVGDCPIGLINKDLTEIKLMNWLDVGEFGGGTRFITMPEIFQSDKFSSRFGFTLTQDFSYLMLMTDGIYDPKFVVEANLEKIESWKEFLEDLNGKNDDNSVVDFNYQNLEIANQLSTWMDFWNPGNHDDRTLAIIY
jgi:Protein phosphatase 2C